MVYIHNVVQIYSAQKKKKKKKNFSFAAIWMDLEGITLCENMLWKTHYAIIKCYAIIKTKSLDI